MSQEINTGNRLVDFAACLSEHSYTFAAGFIYANLRVYDETFDVTGFTLYLWAKKKPWKQVINREGVA